MKIFIKSTNSAVIQIELYLNFEVEPRIGETILFYHEGIRYASNVWNVIHNFDEHNNVETSILITPHISKK